MARSRGLSHARLRPPRIPRDAVQRPALVDMLLDSLERPLVTVIAGAGYGKTTLLATAERSDARRWAWCSCDSRIRDTTALANRIAAAVGVAAPGFEAGLDFVGADTDELGAMLGDALFEIVAEEWVLAVDDAHLIPDRACALFPPLLEALPEEAHLLIASRRQLPIARLRTAGIAEIGERDLRFSDGDADRLVRSFGAGLSEDSRRRVVEDAEGWAAGIVLGAQAGGAVSGSDFRFEYLAEEVVGRLADDRQDFLMKTAVPTRFDSRLAQFLTGVEQPEALISGLMRDHLFVSRIDSEQEWYRYHHLFKAFLNERLAEASLEALVSTHRRAARWWSEQDEPVEVVRHLIAAGDLQEAADYLEPVVEGLITGPEAELVSSWLEAITEDVWGKRPGLVAANAALLLTRARHEEGFAAFDRAIADFAASGDHERAAALTVRLQQAMLTAGTQPEWRIRLGERAIARVDESARLLPAARVLLASAYGYGCRFEEARHQLLLAEALPGYDDEVELMARVTRAFYVDFWQESAVEALTTVSAIRATLSERDVPDPLGLLAVTAMLEGYLMLELGYLDEFARALDPTFDFLENAGMGRDAARRVERWVRCTLYAGQGEWELLEEWSDSPPHTDALQAATSYTHRYRVPEALLAAARGRRAEADAQIQACIAEMDAFGPTFDRALFLCDLARAATLAGNDRLAARLSRDARDAAAAIESPWLSVRSLIWRAATSPAEAPGALAEALEVTERFDLDPAWTHRERGIAGDLLATAVELGVGPAGVASRLYRRITASGSDASGGGTPGAVAAVVPWTRDELELWTGRLERNDGAVGGQIVADQARLLSTAPDATPGPSGERGLDALSVRFLLAGARELERRGDLEGALVCRQRLAEMPGAEERWSRDLMVLLDQAGRLAEALRVYQVCRARLHRDHGRPPTPETDDLYATLLLQRDRDAAQREAAHLTVVFTDIVGSTRMAEEVGDRRWAVVVADHEELLGVHAVEFGGQVVKTQGDGAMIVFDRASHALAFAASVQRAVAVAGGDGPGLAVRIGMHSGDAVRHGHDYLGRTVITAARIMDQCGGGEVLVSEATRTSPGLEHLDFDGPRRVALKGLTGEMGVWRLLWAAVPS